MRENPAPFHTHVLAWYDENARELPWRVSPERLAAGQKPNPYHVWLSEVMLQQTTVAAATGYFLKILKMWPTVQALADADDEQVMAAWAGLGYYARARNLLKCARAVCAEHRGTFPGDQKSLLALPGIGPYTAAAIQAIAFDHSAVVVDGNVERVMARFFAVKDSLPGAKPALWRLAAAVTPTLRCGDYAQGVMDLGATICIPKSPKCPMCPVHSLCQARRAGIEATLPQRSPKPVKSRRFGIVYLTRNSSGSYLLERRPARGLLGGMLGWPGSDWTENPAGTAWKPPVDANWHELRDVVRHTFTHFDLELQVKIGRTSLTVAPNGYVLVPAEKFDPADLPTVMRKAYDMASRMGRLN